MLKTMSEEENLDRLFYLTGPVIYTPGNFIDKDVVYQFNLEGKEKEHSYYLAIMDRKMEYRKGRHPRPDLIVGTTVDEWLKIANQTANPAKSILLGRTRIKGEMRLFRALGKALSVNSIRFRDEAEEWEKPKGRRWEKPGRILVINGSPRARNGYTHYYLRQFIDGIEGAGVEAEEIDIYDKSIGFEPCRGCFACWEGKSEGKCVMNDGASEIVKRIFESYLTIYAFPVYIDSVPARLKALMDRQFITMKNQFSRFGKITRHPFYRPAIERYTAMFATNGFPEREHFEPLSEMFRRNARSFRAPLIAEVIRPGATALYEEPTLYPHLLTVSEALKQAGRELAVGGRVPGKLLKVISSLPRNYTKDAWYFMSNRFNKLENKRPPQIERGALQAGADL